MIKNYLKLMSENYLKGCNHAITLWSKFIIIAFLVYAVGWTDSAGKLFLTTNNWILVNLGWFYIYSVAAFLVFAIYLAISKYGKIKLGADDEIPEFKYWSWIAMLFGAGLGIGLVFWSIAEPMWHYASNPFISADASAADKTEMAMQLTIFHWGLHPWAIYVVTGLSLAYFCYRKGLPLSIRSAVQPIFGDKINGPIGYIIDILAIFGTVFGVATSLGLGSGQVAKGLQVLTGEQFFGTPAAVYGLVAVITGIAIYSAVTGVSKGIRILSEINLWLSIIVLLLLFILGPTVHLIGAFFTNIGNYTMNVFQMSVELLDVNETKWQTWWTIFYWGWWISWSPFVGMFIARISRGRTIREFVVGVLFVSTLISIVWLTIFGNTALFLEQTKGVIFEAVQADLTSAMYVTFTAMDISSSMQVLLSVLTTILVITYFITSADSGTLVLSTIGFNGDPKPPKSHRITWGVLEGLTAAVLLSVDGLNALQSAAIIVALPFTIVIWLMAISLMKSLREEKV